MADGNATNMAAKPPQISPDKLARESVCDVDMADMTVFCQYLKFRLSNLSLDLAQAKCNRSVSNNAFLRRNV
jgi:hypothetical protein